MAPSDIRKAFMKEFRGLCSNRWNSWDVWSDWLVMASSAIYNAIHHDAAVEEEYMRAVSRYSRDEADAMARLLGMTAQALEDDIHDFLGSIFHELELHNEARGQFFTPFEVCRMMAAMSIPEPPRPGRLLKVHEPAAGSGAMVLAFHAELARIDPTIQPRVFYALIDLDDRAFRMAYIQCALCGLAAEVSRGNTLTLDIDRTWRTPGFYIHDTTNRLRIDGMLRALQGDDHAEVQDPRGIDQASAGPRSGDTVPALEDLQDDAGRPEAPADPAEDAAPAPVLPDLILPRPGEQFSLFG